MFSSILPCDLSGCLWKVCIRFRRLRTTWSYYRSTWMMLSYVRHRNPSFYTRISVGSLATIFACRTNMILVLLPTASYANLWSKADINRCRLASQLSLLSRSYLRLGGIEEILCCCSNMPTHSSAGVATETIVCKLLNGSWYQHIWVEMLIVLTIEILQVIQSYCPCLVLLPSRIQLWLYRCCCWDPDTYAFA
jgi:hypothetical protein